MVKDSGIGISMEDQIKLFQPFAKLKAGASLNPNGIGLGLSICKKICQNLNGDIWLKSSGTAATVKNRGSTFTFTMEAYPVGGDGDTQQIEVEIDPIDAALTKAAVASKKPKKTVSISDTHLVVDEQYQSRRVSYGFDHDNSARSKDTDRSILAKHHYSDSKG